MVDEDIDDDGKHIEGMLVGPAARLPGLGRKVVEPAPLAAVQKRGRVAQRERAAEHGVNLVRRTRRAELTCRDLYTVVDFSRHWCVKRRWWREGGRGQGGSLWL